MPDIDDRLRRDLLAAVAADAAATPIGSPDLVRARARRRRQGRGLLAGTAILLVAAGTVAAVGLPVRDGDASRLANGGLAPPVVLDEGIASDGPWELVVTDENGWCIEHIRPLGRGGACGLADPGRLQEASSFRTEDDGEPVVIVNGPVQNETVTVTVELADRPPVRVAPTLIGGRLFFSARTPADARVTAVIAQDQNGNDLARLGDLPPPPP